MTEDGIVERVKDRILRSAAELFMERGFAGTTVRDIGERAGVGQSSLYHHAHSKGELLRELHETFVQEQIGMLDEAVSSDESPTVQLRAVITAITSVVETHRPVVTVYLRESHALSEEARDQVGLERDKVNSIIDMVLKRGLEAGEFRSDIDVQLTRQAILGMCNWTYQWYRPDGPQTMKEISEGFAELVVSGVTQQPARKPRKTKD